MGKYPYMSPEQAAMKGTDCRSDIFSLGITIYECLLQKKLFPAKSKEDLFRLHKKMNIAPPSTLSPWINPELSEIVMSMLYANPDDRIKNARKIVLKLEMYMYEEGYGPTNEKLALYIKKLLKGR